MSTIKTGIVAANRQVAAPTRKIMMRKYGLEEKNTYVETATLLEPNNFIPSWVSGHSNC